MYIDKLDAREAQKPFKKSNFVEERTYKSYLTVCNLNIMYLI